MTRKHDNVLYSHISHGNKPFADEHTFLLDAMRGTFTSQDHVEFLRPCRGSLHLAFTPRLASDKETMN